jgi:hypothetical protein
MPQGFLIDIFAHNLPDVRSMGFRPSSNCFFRDAQGRGKVHAVRDVDGDNKADNGITLLSDDQAGVICRIAYSPAIFENNAIEPGVWKHSP